MEKELEEMLIEIASVKYESFGFPFVCLDYSSTFNEWCITWRNPVNFTNEEVNTGSKTPTEACIKALRFINKRKKQKLNGWSSNEGFDLGAA